MTSLAWRTWTGTPIEEAGWNTTRCSREEILVRGEMIDAHNYRTSMPRRSKSRMPSPTATAIVHSKVARAQAYLNIQVGETAMGDPGALARARTLSSCHACEHAHRIRAASAPTIAPPEPSLTPHTSDLARSVTRALRARCARHPARIVSFRRSARASRTEAGTMFRCARLGTGRTHGVAQGARTARHRALAWRGTGRSHGAAHGARMTRHMGHARRRHMGHAWRAHTARMARHMAHTWHCSCRTHDAGCPWTYTMGCSWWEIEV